MLLCNILPFSFQVEKTQKTDRQKSSWDKAVSSCFAPGFCSLINALISLAFAIYYCVGCVYWNCICDYLFPVHYINVLLYKGTLQQQAFGPPWKKSYIPDLHCEISRHFLGLTDGGFYCISRLLYTSVFVAFPGSFLCHYTKIKCQTCISVYNLHILRFH